MRRKLRCRHHRIVGYDHIACTVIKDTDDRAVRHRVTRQITHTLLGTFAVEIASLQARKHCSDLPYIADSRHITDLVIDMLGHIDGYIAAVTFSPTLFPKISGRLGHLPYGGGQRRTVFQY